MTGLTRHDAHVPVPGHPPGRHHPEPDHESAAPGFARSNADRGQRLDGLVALKIGHSWTGANPVASYDAYAARQLFEVTGRRGCSTKLALEWDTYWSRLLHAAVDGKPLPKRPTWPSEFGPSSPPVVAEALLPRNLKPVVEKWKRQKARGARPCAPECVRVNFYEWHAPVAEEPNVPVGVCVFCRQHKDHIGPVCDSFKMRHEFREAPIAVAPQPKKRDAQLCVHCGLHPRNPASATNGCEHDYTSGPIHVVTKSPHERPA